MWKAGKKGFHMVVVVQNGVVKPHGESEGAKCDILIGDGG